MGKWSIAEVSRGKHGLLRTESSNIRTPQDTIGTGSGINVACFF